MLSKGIKAASVLVCGIALPLLGGCACNGDDDLAVAETRETNTPRAILSEWPADAKPGECYAKVYVAPTFRTVSERVLKREASERLEIVPAKYEWVEEKILVKDSSAELVEVPAEFKVEERGVLVKSSQTNWVMNPSATAKTADGQVVNNMYCLVTTPPETKTVPTQLVAKPACCREVAVPAEYQTVKRQKLVSGAMVKRVPIPAEYETVDKTIAVAPGRIEWQRVICDTDAKPVTLNAVKGALIAAGYKTGPMNGELNDQDWAALRSFQAQHGLGVGALSYETLKEMQIAAK